MYSRLDAVVAPVPPRIARLKAQIERSLAESAALRIMSLTLAYAALAALFTWPLIMHVNGAVTSPIDPVDSVWRISWAQQQLLHHPLHLFAGNTFYPFPDSYFFDGLILGVAVLMLPLAVVGVPALAIYNSAVLLSFVFSALAMYALARRFGALPLAAFVAGLIYAYAPMHLDRIGHLAFLSAEWFPLIVLLLDRVIAMPRPRDTVALAACLAVQALSTQYYAIYLAFLVPLFLVIMLLRRPETRRWAVWGHVFAAVAVALIVIAPVALALRRVQILYGVERSYDQITYYSATLTSFVTADGGNVLWGRITAPLRTAGTYTFERVMFPGLLALTLATIGFCAQWRRARTQFLAALAVMAAALALGPVLRVTPDSHAPVLLRHLPYDVLYWHVTGFDSMRVPARFGTLFLLGVAGLAAIGLTTLLGWARFLTWPRLRAFAPIAVSVAVLCGLTVEYLSAPVHLYPLETGQQIPPVYRWLAQEPDARVLELPLVIPDHDREEQIAVREQYFSLVHGHPIVNGYANVLPKGYRALVLDLRNFPSPRTVALLQGLGITDVVVHFDQLSAADRTRMAEGLRAGNEGLAPAVEFGNTAVYRVAPSPQLAALRALIPRDASLRLSREDPEGTGAYMGMLGYVLEENPLYARLTVGFGETYRGPPVDGQRYDYAILYPQEDPATVGFAGADMIWQDSVVRVYRQHN